MARKSWNQLSASYRQRLERAGITPEQHARGTGLQQARGHVSAQHEQKQGRYRRSVDRFVRKQERVYGKDPEDVRDELSNLSQSETESLIRQQETMERQYDKGYFQRATRGWEARDADLPDWMYWYHGTFS